MRLLLGLMLGLTLFFAGVDINNVGEKELAQLKGIGVAKAKEIIAYRDANGCFTSINDLAKIKGISEKIVAKNTDALTLGEYKK